MLSFVSRSYRSDRCAACASLALLLVLFAAGSARGGQQTQGVPQAQASLQKSTEAASVQRIPRQQALTTAAVDGVLREAISPTESRPVAAAQVMLRNLQTGQIVRAVPSAEGVFRILLLPPGHYEISRRSRGIRSPSRFLILR